MKKLLLFVTIVSFNTAFSAQKASSRRSSKSATLFNHLKDNKKENRVKDYVEEALSKKLWPETPSRVSYPGTGVRDLAIDEEGEVFAEINCNTSEKEVVPVSRLNREGKVNSMGYIINTCPARYAEFNSDGTLLAIASNSEVRGNPSSVTIHRLGIQEDKVSESFSLMKSRTELKYFFSGFVYSLMFNGEGTKFGITVASKDRNKERKFIEVKIYESKLKPQFEPEFKPKVESEYTLEPLRVFKDPSFEGWGCKLSRNGEIIAVRCIDNKVRVYDLKEKKDEPLAVLECDGRSLSKIALSQDGMTIVVGSFINDSRSEEQGLILAYDLKGKKANIFGAIPYEGIMNSLSLNSAGTLVSYLTGSKMVHLYDLGHEESPLSKSFEHTDWANSTVLSGSGKVLLIGDSSGKISALRRDCEKVSSEVDDLIEAASGLDISEPFKLVEGSSESEEPWVLVEGASEDFSETDDLIEAASGLDFSETDELIEGVLGLDISEPFEFVEAASGLDFSC